MKHHFRIFTVDTLIPCCAFFLALSGILTITSGAGTWDYPLEPAMRQLGSLAVAVVIMFSASRIDFKWLISPATLRCAGISGWLFLAGVLIFGTRINNMCGWYRFNSWSIQPAEINKAIYLLILAAILAGNNCRKKFFFALLIAAIWVIPIVLQPDYGTAVIYILLFFSLAWAAGCRLRDMALCFGAGCAAMALLFYRTPYVMKRFAGFLNGGRDNWHILQFELTVSRGGWLGSKLGKAIWSNAYLPLAYNDSAYATLSETLGFTGAVIIILLLAVLVAALLKSASRTTSPAARLFITAAAILIALQSLIHISVNLALLPPTGLNLPFISYGGSSLTGFALLLGLAMSAAASGEKSQDQPDAEQDSPAADR